MKRTLGSVLAATALTIAALNGGAGCARPSRLDSATDALRTRLREARARGDYEAAVRSADTLLAWLAREPDRPRFENADGERLVKTLRLVAGLDSSTRAELATADLLTREIERFVFDGEYSHAYQAATLQHQLRARILGAEHPETLESEQRLGALAEQQGRYGEAQTRLGRVLESERRVLGNEHPAVVRTLNALAQSYKRVGHQVIPSRYFEEALALGRRVLGPDAPEAAESLMGLANLERSRGRLGEARELMQQALEIRGRAFGEASLEVADCRSDLGLVYVSLGRWKLAENELQRALVVRRRFLPRNHPSLRVTLNLLGHCLQAQGRYREAEHAHRESGRIADFLRAQIRTGENQLLLRPTQYYDLAATLLAQGRESEAWPCVEHASGSMTTDIVLGGEARGPFTLERIQSSLDPRSAIIGWLDVTPGMSEAHSAWGYAVRDRGPVRWVRLRPTTGPLGAHIFHRDPLFVEILRAAAWPVRAERPRAVMRIGNELWRERFAPLMPQLRGVSDLVVVSSGGVHAPIEALVDDSNVFLGDRYRVSYANSASIAAYLRERGEARRKRKASTRLEDAVSTGRADATPHPQPRALLIGDPPFSPHDLATMEEEGRSGTGIGLEAIPGRVGLPDARVLRSAASGDPEGLAMLPRLVQTRWEIEQLARILADPFVLVGPLASEAAIDALARSGRLRSFDTVHIASHFLPQVEVRESAIVLSQVGVGENLGDDAAPVEDGLLTAGEILSRLRFDADLVTISGCVSAVHSTHYGEGLFGAAYAFLGAGAVSAVGSVARADDRATALVMTRFYENLTGSYQDDRGMGGGFAMRKLDALSEAKRWLRDYRDATGRQPYRHPAYWAGFILIGDPG